MNDMINVLDHGEVRLRDKMGDDLAVIDAARVSFNKRSDWQYEYERAPDPTDPRETIITRKTIKGLKDADERLLNFLANHGHWSPFSHATLKFEIKAPMLVKNQWIKHRIGMSYLDDEDAETWDNEGWNEMSMRYVSPSDFYIPDTWREAPENRKQGSGGDMQEHVSGFWNMRLERLVRLNVQEYNNAIDEGVAPELARLYLPMYAMYTSWIWTTSLYGVVRFLHLRTKEDAQYEIRQYADAVAELARPLFPRTFNAFGL
jgi:thymidylate synthase (FAD)